MIEIIDCKKVEVTPGGLLHRNAKPGTGWLITIRRDRWKTSFLPWVKDEKLDDSIEMYINSIIGWHTYPSFNRVSKTGWLDSLFAKYTYETGILNV
jgi:hypothetical protein